jgi:hypothetical protein
VSGLASFAVHQKFDLSSDEKVLFRFSAQFIEVRRLQEESQGLNFLRQFSIGVLLQKLAHQLVIPSFGLGFHAGIQLRLKLNIDLFVPGYLTHPLTATIFSGKQIEAERA